MFKVCTYSFPIIEIQLLDRHLHLVIVVTINWFNFTKANLAYVALCLYGSLYTVAKLITLHQIVNISNRKNGLTPNSLYLISRIPATTVIIQLANKK